MDALHASEDISLMGTPWRRPPRHTGDAARHAPRGTSSSGRAESAVAVVGAVAAPELSPPSTSSEGGTAVPAGAPDDGSVTVHDQVVRYQEAGAAVPPDLLAAPNLLPHLHTDHAASGHASPHAPGGVSEPDARYSDVISEAMKSADGGVWDLKRMYCSPLFFSAPTFSPGGEASPMRPVLLFPSGKSGDACSSPPPCCLQEGGTSLWIGTAAPPRSVAYVLLTPSPHCSLCAVDSPPEPPLLAAFCRRAGCKRLGPAALPALRLLP